MGGMQCCGCGSTNVSFDAKQRILICNQCGKEEYYSRATLNANGKVVFARQNAIRAFTSGKLEDARHYAMEVLNISMDNAPALYILAYYDEFTVRKPDSMGQFFASLRDVALEYDEVADLRSLMLASAYNLADYEENVIELVAVNMQAEEDAPELCKFIDAFCPYLIGKRTSAGFLRQSLAEMYQELPSWRPAQGNRHQPGLPLCQQQLLPESQGAVFLRALHFRHRAHSLRHQRRGASEEIFGDLSKKV